MLRSSELARKRLKIIWLTHVHTTVMAAADRHADCQSDCQSSALGVRHATAGRKLGTRMWGSLARSGSRPSAAVCALVLALALCGCGGETFQRGYVLPEGALEQIPLGASQEQVLLVLGTPSTVATVSGEAFYYISQKAEREISFLQTKVTDQRVIAVYFDKQRRVQRLAEYGMKDGKVFDFVSRTTPTAGNDLNVLNTLLHNF